MADLMKKASADYLSLAEEYGDFRVPAVKAEIGGKRYSSVTANGSGTDGGLLIERMDAYLCHSEGSSVSLVMGGAYDMEGSRFKETVSLGDRIKIEVGYGSVFHEIFLGFVGELQYDYSAASQYIHITGLDAIALMSRNFRGCYYYKKKYSDIVADIVGDYSGILSKGQIDSSGEEAGEALSCGGMSDYEYINGVLCPLAEKEFYIFDGKAYFRAVKDREQSPTVSLKLGQSIFDFRITSAYANMEIQVRGSAGADLTKEVTGKASGKTDSSQKSPVTSAQKRYIPFLYAADTAGANAYASYFAEKNISNCQTAECLCIGLPELVPGRCVGISGIQKKYDGKKFWVESVRHKIDDMGFTSEFTVKGWS